MSQHFKNSEALLPVLRVTEQQIKLVSGDGQRPKKITPARAIILVKSGDYEGGGYPTRVRFIRSLDDRPQLPYVPCWRNDGAAVLPPSAEWFKNVA